MCISPLSIVNPPFHIATDIALGKEYFWICALNLRDMFPRGMFNYVIFADGPIRTEETLVRFFPGVDHHVSAQLCRHLAA